MIACYPDLDGRRPSSNGPFAVVAGRCVRCVARQADGSLSGVVCVLFAGEIFVARVAAEMRVVPALAVSVRQLIIEDQLPFAG